MKSQVELKEVINTVHCTYNEYVEDGYCSEEIEESNGLNDINKMIEKIYKLLTPKKLEQLDDDLDDIQMEIKQSVEYITENCLVSYRRRLEIKLKRLDNRSYMSSEWYLNPKLAGKSL